MVVACSLNQSCHILAGLKAWGMEACVAAAEVMQACCTTLLHAPVPLFVANHFHPAPSAAVLGMPLLPRTHVLYLHTQGPACNPPRTPVPNTRTPPPPPSSAACARKNIERREEAALTGSFG